jgi:O-antigen/teichoic acid export membrane protein
MINKLKSRTYDFLRWSQKYTGTDNVYLAKGGFWLTLGQIVSAGASFLLAIAFANLLDPVTYGNYRYILSITGILAISTLSGINTAITRSVARGYEGSIITGLKTKIHWGLIGSLVSLILAGYYHFNGNSTLTISFLIVSVFLPFIDSFGAYNAFLYGKKLFGKNSIYGIISQVAATTILIATLFVTKNIFVILLAYFISWTTMRLIFLVLAVKKFQNNNIQDPEVVSYGKKLSFIGIIGVVATNIDKVLLFHYLGATELAIYSFATIIPEKIKSAFKNIGVLALPKFSQKREREIQKTILPKIIKFAVLMGIIALVYALVAPLIYKLFFPQYLDSIKLSQLYAISFVVAPFSVITSYFESQKKISHLFQYMTISHIIGIIIIFLGIFFFGMMGAIIGKVAYKILAAILYIFFLRSSKFKSSL